ncbi:MAG TPA: TetR/AcrR family transcriptional regulator [Noviherbaspirillum sp.]|nr:TetR/AcrR family transcriptional regulator [Noviherbaspirillum sp.]
MIEPVETKQQSERPYAGQDHAERVALRRQRLIEAGIAQFGTLGYHATTMRTLTAASGLTNRYFYESFESLEDLLVACYSHLMDQYRVQLLKVLEDAPPDLASRLDRGLRAFFGEMRNPHFARITQVEVLGVSPRVDALYGRYMRDFGLLTIQAMTPPERLRNLGKRDADILAFALAGAMSAAAAYWMRTQYRDSMERMIANTSKVLMGTAQQLAADLEE